MIDITRSEPGLAERLAEQFNTAGYSVRLVDAPEEGASITVLTEGATGMPVAARHWAALQAARNAKKHGSQIILVQHSAADTGLEGLARTLRQEWPGFSISCWTLPPVFQDHALPSRIWQNAEDLWFTPDGEALRPQLGPQLSGHRSTAVNNSGVWLVTGGARGVTASCAIELARQSGGTFILVGRSEAADWPEGIAPTQDLKILRGLMATAAVQRGDKPSPILLDKAARAAIAGEEIRTTLARISETGAQAIYMQMDTADAVSVRSVTEHIRQEYGPITGLVHGAGIIADRLADEKTEDELRKVFAPKVEGLFNILSNIDTASLRHVGLFSSASAYFGNRGQSDYAMANAILANTGRALAAELPRAQIKVFDWGPWEGGMVDATLAAHFKEQGVSLIPLTEGARIFTSELLSGNPSEIELVIGTVRSHA